jgi:diguanylate cyclase (GGDEF)-like protein/PAS domain S-box-containing protein
LLRHTRVALLEAVKPPSRQGAGKRLRWLYATALLVVAGLYVALPEPPRFLWTLIGLLSLAGLVTGVLVNQPRRRLPWWLATSGVASLMLGDLTYDVLTGALGQENPFPSVADPMYLAMYPLIAGGLLLVIRARSPRGDSQAFLDACIVTAAVALLAWVFLAAPYVRDETLTWTQQAVSIGYPLGDLLLLAVLARLLIGSGSHSRSKWLLAVGTLGLLVSDVLYGLAQLGGSWSTGGSVDIGWIVFYGAWGAAALQPDMVALTRPARLSVRKTSRWRLLVLGLMPLVAPGLLLWELSDGAVTDVAALTVSSAVLFLLVSLRLNRLVDSARHSTQREHALRKTGESLVAASTRQEVHEAGAAAIRQISGRAARLLIAAGKPTRVQFDSSASQGSVHDMDISEIIKRCGRELRHQHFVITGPDLWDGVLGDARAPRSAVLLAAMLRGDEISGVLVVTGEGVDRPERIDAVCALASQMVLALDSIELTEQVAERKSQEHFRSLVQNASDIILVVDKDLGLSFQTPSAQSILGWDPALTVGSSIDSLVVAADAARTRLMLRRAQTGQLGAGPGIQPDDEWRFVDRHDVVRLFEVSCRSLLDDPSVQGIVVTLHDITDRRKLESELKHLAYHDSLTQLPNRVLFLDRVQHALARSGRHRERLAVMLIDVDNFKVINDTRGHAAGDALLGQIAYRLQFALRPGDTCARLGGDEFAILAEGLITDDEASQIAGRVAEQLRTPFDLGGQTVTTAASIGVATSDYGTDASELLRQADLAMYAAKEAGKGGMEFFRPALQDRMQRRAELAHELERAVQQAEFRLHYQPIVCLETGQVLGAEALLRWQHPERGLVFPGEFIDTVEASDMAIELGSWVIDQAIAQAASWQRFAPAGGTLKMSLNVAPRQLAHVDFVNTVVGALDRHGVPAEAVVLEITERMLAGKEPQIVQAMSQLQELGVRLAVDDFGTGYSSLGYLRRFPVSTLKIDRSFVQGLGQSPDDHALVEAIVRLAQTFDLDLVAEGVETEEQRAALRRMGCQGGQGYLYSRAVPADVAEVYLAAHAAIELPHPIAALH